MATWWSDVAFTDLHEIGDMFATLAVFERGAHYVVVGPPTPEQLAARRERDRVNRAVEVVTPERKADKAAWQAAWRARNPDAYARELAANAARRAKARRKRKSRILENAAARKVRRANAR